MSLFLRTILVTVAAFIAATLFQWGFYSLIDQTWLHPIEDVKPMLAMSGLAALIVLICYSTSDDLN